jgi:colanic acid/amylovoran biosynthesis glycosyltransferase
MSIVNVAIFVTTFPTISETFVIAHVVSLLDAGHHVDVYAEHRGVTGGRTHGDVARYGILARAHYKAPLNTNIISRIRGAAQDIARTGWRHPLMLIKSLNVLRYGRAAANLSLANAWFHNHLVRNDYDIAHCHFGPNGLRAIAMRAAGAFNAPIITTFHGYDVNVLPQQLGRKLYSSLFRKGDLFTVGSRFMGKRLIALGAPPARVITLPIGVDLARYTFASRTRCTSGVRLLTVARLTEVKGIEYLLGAISKLIRDGLSVVYTVVGDGPIKGDLQRLVRRLQIDNAVHFVGSATAEEMPMLYREADIFVLPSVRTPLGEEEGQAIVLAEAQACGLPVIATRTGALPEAMVDGVSGLLVKPESEEALARGIHRMVELKSYWIDMGKAGREFVAEKFNLRVQQQKLAELYNDLVIRSETSSNCRDFTARER